MSEPETRNEIGPLRLWGLGTSRTLRAIWTLLELDLPFAHEPIITRTAAMESEAFRAVSPRGKIPILDDGELRTGESAAICLHLADRYRDRGVLAPAPGTLARARHDELCWFAMTEMDAALYVMRRHDGLPEVYGASDVAVRAARDYFLRSSEEIDRRLDDGRPCLLGDDFTIADLLVKTCLDWARMIYGIPLAPRLVEFSERLAQRPAFGAAMQQNFPPEALAAAGLGGRP